MINEEEEEEKQRKNGRKGGVLVWFYWRNYLSIHFSFTDWRVLEAKKCDVSTIYGIHNGLDNVVAFEVIPISHRICLFFFSLSFFLFLRIYYILQNVDRNYGKYVKILEYFHLSWEYFKKIFGFFFISALFQQKHDSRIDVTQTIRSTAFNPLNWREFYQQCDNSLYVFRFLSYTRNAECKWSCEKWTFFVVVGFFFHTYTHIYLIYILYCYILLETWSKVVHKIYLHK